MLKMSKNAKLNGVLNEIYEDLQELGINEVKRYKKEFKHLTDYNIVEYGNVLIYYDDIKEMYKRHGYRTMEKMSNNKVWETYKRQVGYVARVYF